MNTKKAVGYVIGALAGVVVTGVLIALWQMERGGFFVCCWRQRWKVFGQEG